MIIDLLQNKKIKTSAIIFTLLVIGLLSFMYLFVTRFPIGDDPANHIVFIRDNSYGQIFSRFSYPLPLSIFKFFHSLLSLPITTLFIILICTNLLAASIAFIYFAKTISNSLFLALTSTIIFVTDRWVNDCLRMGLFAETFGWIIFILCSIFYLNKRYVLFFISFSLLVISHPFSTLALITTIICFSVLELLNNQSTPDDKKFVLIVSAIFLAMFTVGMIFTPGKINSFLNFDTNGLLGFSERTLHQFFAPDSPRQLLSLIPFFAGIFILTKEWKRREIRFLYILLFVGFFLSFNHVLGIHFLPFRFYPYLIIPYTIFVIAGISYIIDRAQFKINYYALMLSFICMFLLINCRANIGMYISQSRNLSSDAIMLSDDRTALSWLKNNSSSSDKILAPWKVALWINALNNNTNTTFYEKVFNSSDNCQVINNQEIGYQFIYVRSNNCSPNEAILADYEKVFSNEIVKIYKRK